MFRPALSCAEPGPGPEGTAEPVPPSKASARRCTGGATGTCEPLRWSRPSARVCLLPSGTRRRSRDAYATPLPGGRRPRGERLFRMRSSTATAVRPPSPRPITNHRRDLWPSSPSRRPTTASRTRTRASTRTSIRPRTASRPSPSMSIRPHTRSPSATSMTASGQTRSSVRVEEWVNALRPGISTAARRHVRDRGRWRPDAVHRPRRDPPAHRPAGPRGPRDRARQDASLTFVIDTSGSMEREGRLELVKDALARLVDGLGRGDTVAIVTFGDPRRSSSNPRRRPIATRSSMSSTASSRAGRPTSSTASGSATSSPARR